MMTFANQLLSVSNAYAVAQGIELSRASWRAFSESKTLDDLAAGRTSPTLKRADRALQWFSDHWPEGAVWPAEIPRPGGSNPSAASGPAPLELDP